MKQTHRPTRGVLDLPYTNLQNAWVKILEQRPDDAVVKVPVAQATEFLSFKVLSLYRRALRVANAFTQELGLAAGDGVAILTDDPHDFTLAVHGCWLGRLVAFPLDLGYPDDLIVSLLNNCNIKAVLFPPAASARVASMFDRSFSVAHWLVTGSSTIGGRGSAVRRFEEVVVAATGAGDTPPGITDEDCLALTIVSPGHGGKQKGISYTQSQLLHSGMVSAHLYPPDEEYEDLVWCPIPRTTLSGLVQNILTPLFSSAPTLIDHFEDFRGFWDKIRRDDITHVAMTQAQLREVNKRGKTRSWLAPDTLRIVLFSHKPYSSELLATFEKRFSIPIQTVYNISEGGGVLTSFPTKNDPEYINRWMYDYRIPSSGIAVPGVDLKIVDLDGTEVGEEELGQVIVRTDQVMKGYVGTTPGEAYFGQQGFLFTGDEGFFVVDEEENRHIFVTGRLSELIIRNNQRVNPAHIDNLLYGIKGVDFALTVGFRNSYTGHEVGAFVVPTRTAKISETDILTALRQNLDWYECPKVIVMGDRRDISDSPGRSEFEGRFEEFYHRDFSIGGF